MNPTPTPITIDGALRWFASETGGRIAALVLLYVTIFALERVPAVGVWVNARPTWKRVAAFVLSVGPGLVAALHAGAPVGDVLQTAITALLGATGLNVFFKTSPKGSKPSEITSGTLAALPFALLIAFTLWACVMAPGCWPPVPDSPRVTECNGRYDKCAADFPKGPPANDAAFQECMARVDADCLPGARAEVR